jgi:hypothetical protein
MSLNGAKDGAKRILPFRVLNSTQLSRVAQFNRGRVSDPAQAALSGSQNEAPGSAGGNLTRTIV